jgi:hypothetical protein
VILVGHSYGEERPSRAAGVHMQTPAACRGGPHEGERHARERGDRAAGREQHGRGRAGVP